MEIIGGGTPKTGVPEYWTGSIPWLSVKDFNDDFRYVYTSEKHISEAGLNNSSTTLLQRNDIIISARGTVGALAMIPYPMAFNQSCYGLRANKDIVDSVYLFYLIKNSVSQLRKNTHGSVFDTITRDTFDGIDVEIPSIDVQTKIVGILSAIDNKIEANSRINENLLQQAEALFKERFLTCNDLPCGWKRMTLGEVSDMSAGGDKPKNISDKKTEEHQYPVYSNGISDEGLYGFTSDYKISEECVTVSARGTIGFVCLRHIPFTPIVRLVTLVPHPNIVSAKYLYLWLKNTPIHGTGTTQQQLTVPDFRKTEIIIPSEADMKEFTEFVDPLFRQVWSNQEENIKLAAIRDTILPRLMSGELDVSELDL